MDEPDLVRLRGLLAALIDALDCAAASAADDAPLLDLPLDSATVESTARYLNNRGLTADAIRLVRDVQSLQADVVHQWAANQRDEDPESLSRLFGDFSRWADPQREPDLRLRFSGRARLLADSLRGVLASLGATEPSHQPDRDGKPSEDERGGGWLARALLLRQQHPDWPDRKVAEEVGKHPSTLSRHPIYRAATALARGSKDHVPRGYAQFDRDTKSFGVEAYSSSDDPAEMDWDD